VAGTVCQAENIIGQLPANRVLNVRYEDVLQDPIPNLLACAEFCGLDVSCETVEKSVFHIDSSRAYSYRMDPGLQEFCEEHKKTLAEYGYKAR
jgi:hypothetical protein